MNFENIPVQPPAPIPGDVLRSGDETLKFIYPNGIRQCKWKLGSDEQSCPHKFKPRTERPKILPNVLHAIGNTPLIRLNRIPKSYGIKCEMLAKCEYFNPSGSVKDRIALDMVEDAEEKGILKPGDRFIEATAGNTGLGLAMVATVKGYKCTCVMPLRMSNDKVDAIKALGADVVRTPNAEFASKDCPFTVAQRLCKELPDSIILDQFRNASNPMSHYATTAEEILYQCDGKVDAIVCGAGSGGTMTGIGRKMKEKCPSCQMIGADPLASKLAEPSELNNTGVTTLDMEGIGVPFVASTLDRSVVSKWFKVSDKESMLMARRMISEEGILCGGSSGTAMCAAIQAAKTMKEGERLVVILADGMRNYLTKFVSDPWMKIRDFIGLDDENHWWWSFLPVRLLNLKKPMQIPSTTCSDAIQHMTHNNQNYIFIEKEGTILGTVTSAKILSNLMEQKYAFDHPIERLVDPVQTVNEETPLAKICAIIQVETFVLIESKVPSKKDKESTETILKYATSADLLSFIIKNQPPSNKRASKISK